MLYTDIVAVYGITIFGGGGESEPSNPSPIHTPCVSVVTEGTSYTKVLMCCMRANKFKKYYFFQRSQTTFEFPGGQNIELQKMT